MDVREQIAYWTTGSQEDFDAAQSLVEKGHLRHGLFFAHLAIEKMLKALVVRETKKEPPRIHNLVRLAGLADLATSGEQQRFLRRFDLYQLEGRYPDSKPTIISHDIATQELRDTVEILTWLRAELSM